VNYDPFSKRNVAYDVFSAKRITTASTGGQQVIDAFHDDRIFAKANELFDRFKAGRMFCLCSFLRVKLVELFGTQELR
jgi:hypothetical protein